MAASLSRPDPTSPTSVAEAGFNTARRGYHPDEVRAFLVSVADEMRRLNERERLLEAEVRAARASTPGRVELDDETVASMLGEETLRVLQTARESATQIRTRAEETAARALREAHDEANRLRQEAEVESARRRHDAQAEAEAEVALAKQQGREMVNEARAYRERVLADLDRRTKLARQQIEELAHGRERLLQVFERARLVAVDVTGELQSFVQPDEFVNMSPTTGPIPIMVPGAPPPTSPADAVEPHEVEPVDEEPAAVDSSTVEVGTVEVGTVEVGTVEVGTVEVSTVEVGTVEPVDTDAEAAVVVSPAAANMRDGNVVDLFPGRGDAAAGPDQQRPAADDIFARLRSEAVALDDAHEPDEPVVSEPEAVDAELDPGVEAVDAPEIEATAFSRRDEALVPLIVIAARKLKRVLADEQNGVLDTLRRREPVGALDAVLPSLDAHVGVYVDAIADELVAAAAAGAAELGARDTASLRRTLAKAGAIEPAHALLRTDLVGLLRDRLERSIVDGAGDNDDITRRVRALYREWKTQHIDDVLDDVFRFAFGGGVGVSADPGTPMCWVIDPSEPACADCEDNSLAGPVPAGESYPTGHSMAPAHPGCRCLTVPDRQ